MTYREQSDMECWYSSGRSQVVLLPAHRRYWRCHSYFDTQELSDSHHYHKSQSTEGGRRKRRRIRRRKRKMRRRRRRGRRRRRRRGEDRGERWKIN